MSTQGTISDLYVIDALADKYNISVTDKKTQALCGSGVIEGDEGAACEATDIHELKR